MNQLGDGHDLVHDRKVITNYINGPTPLGLSFDQELKMAVRRFRLKVDAHMAAEWEKARLRRAEAASKRWSRKMSLSRESGNTFSQECAEMLSKVRKKIEIQMAVEQVKLTELMAKEGGVQSKDGVKLNDITAKIIDKKFQVPLADVYCFRSVLTELKEKARGRVTEGKGGGDEAIECLDNQKRERIADVGPDGQRNQNNDKAVNAETHIHDVLDHEVEISRRTSMQECTDRQTDNGAGGYQKVECMLPNLTKPLANINEIVQSMPKDESRKQVSDVASHGSDDLGSGDMLAGGDEPRKQVSDVASHGSDDLGSGDMLAGGDEPRKQVSDVASHGRDDLGSGDMLAGGDEPRKQVSDVASHGRDDLGSGDMLAGGDEPRKQVSDVASHGRDDLNSDDTLAGGDGYVTKGPLNGHEDLGPADNEPLDSDMDEEMKSGCWTFFSRMFRRLRKKKSRP